MGRVAEVIEVSSGGDEELVQAGYLSPDKVRRETLTALVDTGATMLVLPEDVIQRLGLRVVSTVKARVWNGQVVSSTIYGPAKLKVLGRVVHVDVIGVPAGAPALLGQIPLEGLDFVVDTRNQRLVPNPESPDPAMALVDLL
ncbi:MAG: retropepsin-like aspartic protease [Planctomycetota bacterium]